MVESVSSINPYQANTRYKISQAKLDEIKRSHDHIVPKTPVSQLSIFGDKFFNAFTVYPAKGLKGSRNSNFYEFLTMGMVPYTIGSLTLMGLFNGVNKYFKPSARKAASSLGTKMALGVLFYGIAKEASKTLISAPVKAFTGVDINMPYKKFINEFATSDFLPSPKSIEYHKTFESVDFPRFDLLYYKESGKPRNYYYDQVAKKLGKGDDLVASDQEVKNDIKKILVRSKASMALSSFLWAAVGVMYAAQDSWGQLFNKSSSIDVIKNQGFLKNMKSLWANKIKPFAFHVGDLAKKSAVELWNGTGKNKKANAFAGRLLLALALLSSVGGAATTIIAAKSSSKEQKTVDKTKEYMVN